VIPLLALALGACAISRAATATERLADEIRTEVAPAVVALAQSGQRTTDALGDFWDTVKAWGAWAAWVALLSTWPYRIVRPLLRKWKGTSRTRGKRGA